MFLLLTAAVWLEMEVADGPWLCGDRKEADSGQRLRGYT